jgi:hypothetical protein
MDFDWQTVAVVLVIGIACAYLVRAAWRTVARRRAAACGGCGSCPAEAGTQQRQIVGVAQLSESLPTGPSASADRNGSGSG